MPDTADTADVRFTFRLPHDLDQRMRQSAEFFGRSVGAEWRTPARLYGRVLAAWAAAVADDGDPPSATDGEVAEREGLLRQLCEGLVHGPRSVVSLTTALKLDGTADRQVRSYEGPLGPRPTTDAKRDARAQRGLAADALKTHQQRERSACPPSVRTMTADEGDHHERD
jgi:hypothetical protein